MAAFAKLPFGVDPLSDRAPLRNREAAASGTWTDLLDVTLHVRSGTALDQSTWRQTAVPAGSRGRITASGDKLYENGVPVKFNIATLAPDPAYVPLNRTNAEIDAATAHLACCGYNALRVHGIENWLMSGVDGAAVFPDDALERMDYLFASLKAQGIFLVLNPQSYNLFTDMDGTSNRFTYTEASSCKPRLYVEQEIRANWKAGVAGMWNRVNRYTGINILQDPSVVLLELYNESSATFCGGGGISGVFPTKWKTRTVGSTAAAQTWVEWLSDATKGHGYANLAALNASWGTAHASFAAAASSDPPLLNIALPATQQAIDVVLYAHYLEDDLGAFYAASLSEWGYTGLSCMHTMYPQLMEVRGVAKQAVNTVSNWHGYTLIAYDTNPGTTLTQPNNPVWEFESVPLMTPCARNGKPLWGGELGWPLWGKYRNQFPIITAAFAAQGASAVSHFAQGDFFSPDYYNDTTTHGHRLRRLDPYHGPADPITDFIRVLQNALLVRGDVAELGNEQALILNDRHNGVSPRNSARIGRTFYTLLQPLYLMSALRKVNLAWTSDTTDDTLAATWNPKSWLTLLTEANSAGAVSADNLSLVSATTNSGSIASIALTGTVGGLTASATQPVLELTGNTLVDGDKINVTNLTGSAGTWPGTSLRNGVIQIAKGTGNYVQATSGLNLSAASGSMTAGTWCELGNVIESGTKEWGMSRRLKRAWVNTAKTKYFSHDGGALPVTYGALTITALDNGGALFVTSLDGQPISTSARLLIGLVGDSQNTGMAFTDGTRRTLSASAGSGGEYPVQTQDCTASISLMLTRAQEFKLYRLQRDGRRNVGETPTSINAATGALLLSLRTGVVYPSPFFELVR